MRMIRILNYMFLAAILMMMLCRMFGVTFEYWAQSLAILLIIASVLFFVDAYFSKNKKKNGLDEKS